MPQKCVLYGPHGAEVIKRSIHNSRLFRFIERLLWNERATIFTLKTHTFLAENCLNETESSRLLTPREHQLSLAMNAVFVKPAL